MQNENWRKSVAIQWMLLTVLLLSGCGGSGAGTASVGTRTPTPANARLLFHGVLRSDINMNNFPPGGTGRIDIYDDVTGRLLDEITAENGAHFDAQSVPDGHAVKVFFIPKSATATPLP